MKYKLIIIPFGEEFLCIIFINTVLVYIEFVRYTLRVSLYCLVYNCYISYLICEYGYGPFSCQILHTRSNCALVIIIKLKASILCSHHVADLHSTGKLPEEMCHIL
jgi:hypothetical protein